MAESRGLVSEIQRFCLHDGPGVRTVVFLKGCHLSCRWCANPEAIGFGPELMLAELNCLGCGRCTRACTRGALEIKDGKVSVDRSRCVPCERCAEACPTESVKLCGRSLSVSDVMAEAERDLPFYLRSSGGVTLSGGEPAAQADFAVALLRALREKEIHTAVETSGFAAPQAIEAVARAADLILFDVKHGNSRVHEAHTGAGNGGILDNLARIARLGKPIVVRVPVIPGFNDSLSDMVELANVVKDAGAAVTRVDLLPFHRLGDGKYRRLGRPSPYNGSEPPQPGQLEEFAALFQAYDIEVGIGG